MPEPDELTGKRSILWNNQRDLGATFGFFYGWEMTLFYSNASQEHIAVRNNAGVIDLSYNGCIRVTGGEAVQFLNGLVTNDVKTLEAGRGMRAAFLTGHGKVRALCRVLNLGQEFLIVNDPQTHEKVLKYVSPFRYAGDFRVEDVSDQYRLLSVQGPKSQLIMKEICFEPVPSLAEYDWFRTTIAGHQALVARASHTGEHGFDIFVPESAVTDVWDFVLLKGRFHSLVPFGLQALDSLRIEAAVPVYGIDVDETNMLLELGLDDAVSFKKGCYTGQEAVAMATYRGHISKKLSGVQVSGDGLPGRGDIVKKGGKEVGFVTSALRSLTLGSTIALVYIKYGFFDVGNPIEIEGKSGVFHGAVVELPFYRAA